MAKEGTVGFETPFGTLDFGFGGETTASKSYKTRRRHQLEDIRAAQTAQIQGIRDAGMHPLFASGSGVTPYPIAVGGRPQTNIRGQVSSKNVRLEELNQRLLKLQGDYVEEQIKASRYARGLDGGTPGRGAIATPVEFEPAVQTVPISEDKTGQVAGQHPGWKLHDLSFGNYKLKVWAPAQDSEGIFESPTMWPVIYAANREEIKRWAGNIAKDKTSLGKLTGMWRMLFELMWSDKR